MNASVEAIAEAIGLYELLKEVYDVNVKVNVYTDARACKGMLLRQGSGKTKHLSTKQLWVQGAIKAYGIKVEHIGRETNSAADMLTHETTRQNLEAGMTMMGYEFLE